ncbi:unnamed protein product [Camellia sinensis]
MILLNFHGFIPFPIKVKCMLNSWSLKLLLKNNLVFLLRFFEWRGEGEFVNHSMQAFMHSHGIHHQFSCPHTPSQNGAAERKHLHINEMAICLLHHSSIPLTYWFDVVVVITFLINRLPSVSLSNQSPYELLFDMSDLLNLFFLFLLLVHLLLLSLLCRTSFGLRLPVFQLLKGLNSPGHYTHSFPSHNSPLPGHNSPLFCPGHNNPLFCPGPIFMSLSHNNNLFLSHSRIHCSSLFLSHSIFPMFLLIQCQLCCLCLLLLLIVIACRLGLKPALFASLLV